ncbi:polysaccharide pyruvyl transferase family protein [Amaricoccus solimangrovi]|uniref:Polysaccharide pyruvyl transferase domain-containing protein n=1 Tax=Amaricoccus solimangrovi TaxID=2589815 RepID=A0A501WN42_9RHOB|nr:polysaccharide pyruvyl transferase family protein [Amaricoccus solimangrovi]TPE48391.1 hypothetical protein FJM51_17655 [Amaricoccus solimangrovi]
MFTSRKKNIRLDEAHPREAIVVSFFGGDEYYAKCADRLARQCEDFGLSYDICEYTPSDGEGWINICRRKIAFYTEKAEEYGAPILWLDIDGQIIADPRRILRSGADLGAFLRNFRYLVGFDPVMFARLLHPGYLLIGQSDRTRAFLETLRELDRTGDPEGTDDYILQEALERHEGRLGFEIFSPADIVFSNEARGRAGAVFQHGDSGNVKPNVTVATQHEALILTPERRKRVLRDSAEAHVRAKRPREAEPLLREMLRVDPRDPDATLRLLKLYRSLGWKSKHAALARKAEAEPDLAPRILRHRYEAAVSDGDLARAAKLALKIETRGSEADRAFARSRQYRLSFDEEAEARGIAAEARVPLWWWERPYPGNLGDMINPYLIGKLTGVPPRFAPKGERVLAIGSIIKFARPGDTVWGAGCPSAGHPIEPGAEYRAVRGPLTRRMVLEAGGACAPVYGDPAWLLPLVHPDPGRPKTHRLGLIRHFTHRDRPIELGEGVREIEILRAGREGIEAFLDEMLGCEAIVSTSLHGLIIANAYGIPARLATFVDADRQIHGDGMKFDDYFLSIGLREARPFDLTGVGRLTGDFAARCDDNPEREIDLAALIAAAPFEVVPEVLAALEERRRAKAALRARMGTLTRRALAAVGAARRA